MRTQTHSKVRKRAQLISDGSHTGNWAYLVWSLTLNPSALLPQKSLLDTDLLTSQFVVAAILVQDVCCRKFVVTGQQLNLGQP